MIGFYLTIDKNANGSIESLSISYDMLTKPNDHQKQGLYIFEDDRRRQIVQANGYKVFNIGTLIYKNAWQNKALELIMHDLNNGRSIQEIISNTRGQFCLIVHTERNVFVITDKLGSFPIYIFEDDETVQISNVLLLLAKNNKVSVNHQAFAEYLSFNYCFDSTFFNETEHLKMGTIYQFGSERKTQIYDNVFSDIQFNKHTDLNVASQMAKETLVHNLSFLSSDDRTFVDITGGFDTRTIAVLLQSMNIDFEAGICGEQNPGESEIAERVAQILGVELHSDIKITDRHLFKTLLDQHFVINTGVPILYHSTELINYYEYIKRGFDIHVTGFGGTELTKQTLPKLNLLSSRINRNSLLQKYGYKYKDIFVDGFLTKASYYDHLAKKINSLLQKVGSDLHSEVANFLHFSIVNRHYHGCLIGTHNVIMPFYSPFLESNYVRLMLETSYNVKDYHNIQRTILTELNPIVSSIMTSRGYSAHIGSKRINSTFWRSKNGVKNLARRMIYQFGLFEVMKWVENTMTKIKPTINIEEVQWSFWVAEVNKTWSDNMEIFELIDQNKLNSNLTKGRDVSKLKAKILYLNRIINECKPNL